MILSKGAKIVVSPLIYKVENGSWWYGHDFGTWCKWSRKSANGCSFLQKENAFESNSSPDSRTHETSAQSNVINGIKRCYIGTQGLSSSDGLDAKYIKQMVGFLKKLESGVNAIYIIINVQTPRFDQGVQKIIQMINKTFNDPNLWNQTGIIFTRCY